MGSSHYGFHTLASLMDRTHSCEEGVFGIDWTAGDGDGKTCSAVARQA